MVDRDMSAPEQANAYRQNGQVEEGDASQYQSEAMMLSAIPEQGLMIIGVDDRIQFANPNVAELLDVPARLLRAGRPRRDFVEFRAKRGEFGAAENVNISQVLSRFSPGVAATLETVTISGRRICTHSIPLPDGGSAITYTNITGVQHLVDELVSRTSDLEIANQRNEEVISDLQAVVDNIEYGVVFMDKDLRSDIINRAFQEMWSLDRDFAAGRPTMRELMLYNRHTGIYDMSDDAFDEYMNERMEAVRKGPIPRTEMQLNNGRTLSYRCFALPDGRRMLTYFDITTMKARELELRRHAEALEIIQDATGHGLTWFDQDLKLRAWNKKAVELQQFPPGLFNPGDSIDDMFRYNALRGEYGDGNPDKQVADRLKMAARFEPHHFERRKNDGTILKIEGHPVPEGGFVTVFTDVTEKRRTEEQIQFLAHNDALTGLPNRVQFNAALAEAQERARINDETLAVICFDLDHFKEVNDTLGHAVGDLLLKSICKTLVDELGEDVLLSRLGGDEFALILEEITDSVQPANLAKSIIRLITKPIELDGHEIVVGASVGIAIQDPENLVTEPDLLLRNADLALYAAKADGRGSYRYFEDFMQQQLQQRKVVERDLRVAIRKRQFRVFYQPQVDARTSEISGVEALVRWQHPTRGLVMPGDFIDIAESTGLIRQIGEQVLEIACRDIAPYGAVKLAVNLSPVQFRKNEIVEVVSKVLSQTGFPANRLELEITENVLLSDTDETISTLEKLKAKGLSIVLDDFGTGFSSLSYLSRFQFDKLKIDRKFISDIDHSSDSSAIVQAVVGLGKSLGIRSNAEGVETHLQADFLRLQGCDELQGYFFGKAMPYGELRDVLGRPGSFGNQAHRAFSGLLDKIRLKRSA